jgi:hypothetical protein
MDSLKVKLKGLIDVGSGRPKRLTINKCSICAYVMPPSAPHCSNACKLAAYNSPKSDTLYRHSRSVHSH